jgi:hypothetical protein
MARCGRTASSSSSRECHRSQVSSSRTSGADRLSGGGVVARPPKRRALRCSYTRRSAWACSSKGGDAASTVANSYDTVLYPLAVRMAVVLCNLLRSTRMRRLAIRSSAHTGSRRRLGAGPLPRRVNERSLPLRRHSAVGCIRRPLFSGPGAHVPDEVSGTHHRQPVVLRAAFCCILRI